MERILWGAVVILILVGIVALMWWGWRRRARRDRALPLPDTALAEATEPEETIAGLYVSTTPRDQPLERLNIPGLAFRGRITVELHPGGVLLRVSGERPVAIPAEHLLAPRTATTTIDRVVERDGLLVVPWRLGALTDAADSAGSAGGLDVDSYLRITDQQARQRLIAGLERRARGIAPAGAAATTGTEEGR